ncbi:MAG: HD domain-containing protein [Bacteroidota bacterium]
MQKINYLRFVNSINKKKIINDPVYGFVNIPFEIIYDLIENPWFQRLRRIKQLGLSYLVYPGAQHTRFQHVIGAMSLTYQAVEILKSKGIEISKEEEISVCIAVLLHDMGHGPFSHTLEGFIITDLSHEAISLKYMELLNTEFEGKLSMAIDIFTNKYPKKFLHQLVSSQLDMDRLDYLRRDSFYTGVQEGSIGHDRIINMLNVFNDELVIEEKGIYSVEKFLIARRLMYWQVYLHKTVVAAENLLIKIIERAKLLISKGTILFASPSFHYFLYNNITKEHFFKSQEVINHYTQLDDNDILTSIKVWCNHDDIILSKLCIMMRDRNLPKVILQNQPFEPTLLESYKFTAAEKLDIAMEEANYFVYTDSVQNKAYSNNNFHINILFKDGHITDIAQASDQDNIETLTKTVTKYFMCFVK